MELTLELHGRSLIGRSRSDGGGGITHGVNAATGARLEPAYHAASEEDLDRAVALASAAFPVYRALPRAARARFLRAIADRIEQIGDALIERVMQESALPEGRVRGERARTC